VELDFLELVLVVDVSGSIDDALLQRFAPWFDALQAVQLDDWMRITGVRRA
jgi:hypothetical protein